MPRGVGDLIHTNHATSRSTPPPTRVTFLSAGLREGLARAAAGATALHHGSAVPMDSLPASHDPTGVPHATHANRALRAAIGACGSCNARAPHTPRRALLHTAHLTHWCPPLPRHSCAPISQVGEESRRFHLAHKTNTTVMQPNFVFAQPMAVCDNESEQQQPRISGRVRSRHERDSAHTTRHELLLPQSPRPTDAERKEAIDLIAAMRAVGDIVARTSHINPERVACALAMHRGEVFESEREMLRLFALRGGGAAELRETWVDTKFPEFVLVGLLDFYLFSILSEDVEEAEKRDLRNMTSVALTHATLVSAKLCFILLGMTTLLDWSKTAQSVQSVNELRQLMRDLGKPKHCDRCGKSPSASSYLESELHNETVLNAHRRDASCAS